MWSSKGRDPFFSLPKETQLVPQPQNDKVDRLFSYRVFTPAIAWGALVAALWFGYTLRRGWVVGEYQVLLAWVAATFLIACLRYERRYIRKTFRL